MRQVHRVQMQLGEQDIANINFDTKSRDDIPQLLMGLQYIYTTPDIKDQVFKILETGISKKADFKNGRPGMDLWRVLVLGTLRLNLNCDYDRLHELANQHQTIRQMLGHGIIDDMKPYKIQTIKDNVHLLSVELLDQINEVVVKSGHKLLKKKEDEKLAGRCDSFVVETDVHYPTDSNLLFDSIRKVITLTAALYTNLGIQGWRQSSHNLRKIKKLHTKARKLFRSRSKDPKKIAKREKVIIQAHVEYIEIVSEYLDRAERSLKPLKGKDILRDAMISEIEKYISHANRQIDQIDRRVVKGEKIPHDEKIFSIFEEHTEWISKGKAGVPVELGLRVCILEDEYRFILHHHVMEKQTDDQIATIMVEEAQKKYPVLSQCSFDKGFYTPGNRERLSGILDLAVLPKKGRLSEKDKETEHSAGFVKGRRLHSAVESAINALEVHGLDRCLDHGLPGFKKYVSLAVLSRNIQKIGSIILAKKRKVEKRQLKAA
jgi:transposase, IS5 family